MEDILTSVYRENPNGVGVIACSIMPTPSRLMGEEIMAYLSTLPPKRPKVFHGDFKVLGGIMERHLPPEIVVAIKRAASGKEDLFCVVGNLPVISEETLQKLSEQEIMTAQLVIDSASLGIMHIAGAARLGQMDYLIRDNEESPKGGKIGYTYHNDPGDIQIVSMLTNKSRAKTSFAKIVDMKEYPWNYHGHAFWELSSGEAMIWSNRRKGLHHCAHAGEGKKAVGDNYTRALYVVDGYLR